MDFAWFLGYNFNGITSVIFNLVSSWRVGHFSRKSWYFRSGAINSGHAAQSQASPPTTRQSVLP